MKNLMLLFVGAVLGGVIGYYGFVWFASQGFYAMVLPGGLIGVGAGIGKIKVDMAGNYLLRCGALALGLFTEYRFEGADSFGDFLRHVPELGGAALLMIAAGAFLGFWVPFRRIER